MRFFTLILFIGILHIYSPVLADQFEPFTENGKVGLRNLTTNTVAIAPSFEAMGWSDKSFSVINGVVGALQNEKWALVDVEGHKITEHYYSSLIPSYEQNFIASKRDNNTILTQYGLIDARGKTVIAFEYGSILPHPSGLIVSRKKEGKYFRGFISEKGKVIIPIDYQQITSLNDNHLAVANLQNLFSIYNIDGQPLTGFQYEYIRPYGKDYYLVGQYNHQGLLSTSMELIVPPLYKDLQFYESEVKAIPYTQWDFYDRGTYNSTYYFDEINFLNDGKFVTSAEDKTGVINQKNEYLSFFPDELLVAANDQLFVTKSELGRFKVYDANGKALFRDSFEEVELYDQAFFAKNNQPDGHSWGVYNFQGKKLNLFNYQSFNQRSESFFEATRSDKIGLIAANGKEASPFLYDELSDFKNERAIAYYNNGYGVINTNGLWIMTPYYDSLSIAEDYIYFEQGSEYGLADLFGKTVYRGQQPFQTLASAIIRLEADSSKAIFSFSGERLLEHNYDSVRGLSEELLLLHRNNQAFVYRPSDGYDLKLESDIEFIGEMKNGFIPVLKGGQWGFLDSNGRISIANRYEDVGIYSEGYFAVKLIGKWGFVNESEELVVQPNYDLVTPFENGLSVVMNNEKYGVIDSQGQVVVDLNYEGISRIDGYFLLKSSAQIGLADSQGHIIKNPSFDSIWPLSKDYFLVERNDYYGVIDTSGHDIIPTVYQTIKQHGNLFLASKEGEERTFHLK